MSKSIYGYCYTKSGNLVQVNHPVDGNLKPVKKSNKTTTGKIGRGVGYPSPKA